MNKEFPSKLEAFCKTLAEVSEDLKRFKDECERNKEGVSAEDLKIVWQSKDELEQLRRDMEGLKQDCVRQTEKFREFLRELMWI